ncbi:alginate O-acetyltransferase AlgF [Litoreibacter roseus]|uniref:Alginate biosynthesis protein AlgF n=1 Tax=Litoreibacter roseus TaxID=2601869 RepID=A0A6N6JAI9_9RHOB|nr:alginate O-acetyltransferase AlgF [Litoreibacter roseus]GFE63205.1 hypothetical protein KIN_02790 [Litoreibacter roseus]
MFANPLKIAALAVLLSPISALAQDGSLYEPAPDPSMSYVRVIDPGTENVAVGSKRLDDVADGISPYVGVVAGDVPVITDAVDMTLTVEAATYYTVLVSDDGATQIITDAITNSPAKADLAFYNLSDLGSADLFVPRADAMAVEGVVPTNAASVALNAPLELDFEVREGKAVMATVETVSLKRKSGVSIVVTGSAGSYEAISIDNSYIY